MDAARDEFAAANCSVLVVTRARPEVLTQYLARHPRGVPIVSDPDATAYSAFHLKRIGWLSFLRPRVVFGYLVKILRGYLVRMPYPGEDVRQLGGDFVLTRAGDISYAFRDPDPTRRPTVAELLKAAAMTDPTPSPRPHGAGETALHPHQS